MTVLASTDAEPLVAIRIVNNKINKLVCLSLAILVVFCTISTGSFARNIDLEWNKLEFEGSKLLITLNSRIERQKVPADIVLTELYQPEAQKGKVPDSDFVLKTIIKTSVLGNDSLYTLWQNQNLEALQRTTLYTGMKNWYRNYRFLPDEILSLKIKPSTGEEQNVWTSWSDIRKSVKAYSPSIKENGNLYTAPLTDSGAIFEALARDQINKVGDKLSLMVFNKKGNVEVTLAAESRKSIKINFQQNILGNKTRRKNKIDALKIRLDARPLKKDSKKSEFKFMGYKDSIVIYYDPLQNLPVRLTGEADYVGNVQIDLQKASFVRSSPDNS